MDKKLLYIDLKVKLKNPNILAGTLHDVYQEQGYLFINQICDEETVLVSENPSSALSNSMSVDNLIPIYDDNILAVLSRKERQYAALEKEIEEIRNFINNTCKNA